MANGASRIVLAENAIKGKSQSDLNNQFKNENEVAKNVTKFPLKSASSEHNHSK